MSAAQETVNAAFDSLDSNVADFSAVAKKRHYAGYKERRGYVSDNDLMFEHLCNLFGFDADERAGLHLFVARSMDVAPDEKLIINEIQLGGLLPGDGDVTDESLKKRCYRLFQRIDERQRLAGRMVLDRIQGKFLQGERKEGDTAKRFAASKDTLVGPEYRVWFTQAIAEGVDAVRSLRLKGRQERFRQAAVAVFEGDVFPLCEPKPETVNETPFLHDSGDGKVEVDPSETYELLTGEKSPTPAKPATPKKESALRLPRMVQRFKKNAALALERAKEKGEDALTRQAATLYVELGREIHAALGGEAQDTESVLREAVALLQTVLNSPADLSCIEASLETLEAKDIQDTSETRAATSEPKLSKTQENRDSASERLDTGVHHKQGGKRISKEFIEEVRDRSDIVAVVSAHVNLKRKGAEFGGCCPFHEEKTASFSVNPAKGVYHCFGCQAGGDVFKFLQKIEGLQFRDAIKAVAERSGVGWPEEYEQKRVAERAASPRRTETPPVTATEHMEVYEI